MELCIKRHFLTIIRNITADLFLVVFCLTFASTHILFKIRQRSIHSLVEESRSSGETNGEIVILKIPLTEEKQPQLFQRTDKFEIKYKGKMYDLIKSIVVEDHTLYWAVWDVEETELENKFKEITTKDTKEPNGQEILTRFMETLFLSIYQVRVALFLILLTDTTFHWQSACVTRADTPPTPPPKN